MSKKGLGKGLGAIFDDNKTALPDVDVLQANEQPVELAVSEIVPNPHQPRRTFDVEKLSELAASIKEHGVIQPLIVRKNGAKYEIVAGERRWRAAKEAKLVAVPVVVRDYNDATMMEIALIENIQRHNLNPLEEANGIRDLMQDFGLTQEDVAKKIGRSRSAVTNILRLLNLPPKILELVSRETLSMGQAKPILALTDVKQQEALALVVAEQGLSARMTEDLVKAIKDGQKVDLSGKVLLRLPVAKKSTKTVGKKAPESVFYKEYQNKLVELLGTKVKLVPKSATQGKIEIEYYSEEDIERIFEALEGKTAGKEIKKTKKLTV